MQFPFYIAGRYLFTKSTNNTINIITLIAGVGVVVGTMALFIVLSGFSGLRTFSLSFLNTTDPDLKITSSKGKSFLFSEDIEKILTEDPRITSYSKVIEERVFFEFNNKSHIAFLKGVDADYTKVNRMDTTVYIGSWLHEDIPVGAVVGNGISNTLGVGVFDFLERLTIYVPKPGKGYINNPNNAFNKIETQPIGVFSITEETDKKFTFINLDLAQVLLNYTENQISAIELKIDSTEKLPEVINDLGENLGEDFKVETREQLNALFYKMLNTENLASYLIFTLILIIALFNVIGAIIMMILDKRDNLKTLHSLGATVKDIRRIFVIQGFMLSIAGLLIGLALGSLLVVLQKKYSLFMITQHLPYPVEFRIENIITVILTIGVLGYLASRIASSRINKSLVEA